MSRSGLFKTSVVDSLSSSSQVLRIVTTTVEVIKLKRKAPLAPSFTEGGLIIVWFTRLLPVNQQNFSFSFSFFLCGVYNFLGFSFSLFLISFSFHFCILRLSFVAFVVFAMTTTSAIASSSTVSSTVRVSTLVKLVVDVGQPRAC